MTKMQRHLRYIVAEFRVIAMFCVSFATAACVAPVWAQGNATAACAEWPAIRVFAAASLSEAVGDMFSCTDAGGGKAPVLVFASSATVARQVAWGAPADLVLLADQAWADWLSAQTGGVAQVFASNRLAVIGRADVSGAGLDLLLEGDGPIAMAEVETVPAGRYGRAALTHAGVWPALAPRVVQADHVRAGLRYVARGDVDFGIGYVSDLAVFPDLRALHVFPAESHPPIRYAGVAMSDQGAAVLARITAAEGQAVLARWGFGPVEEGGGE